ncbi:MAG: decaprenyl-phosphate phosphoribosyltransferase [Sphingobacterium hotanense]
MGNLFALIRTKHWTKNLFVFLPLFFAGELGNKDLIANCLLAFVAFSFVASAIYCINDILDIEEDRKHPKKRYRPIASGAVSIPTAIIICVVLVSLAFSMVYMLSQTNMWQQIFILACYFVLNILYCFLLKMIAIIDVMIIAKGFVLRILIGGSATNIELTHWIIIMTFLLTLFIGFAKRRDDLVLQKNNGTVLRKNTNRYNLEFINQVLCLLGGITIVCYIMYTVSPEVIERFNSPHIYLTTIFVLGGIVRYLQLALVYERTGSPTEILLKDRFIQSGLLLWILSFYLIIYLNE